MKHTTNILLNILIILLGPLVTVYIVIAGKGFKIKSEMFLYVGVATAIAVIGSAIIQSVFKKGSNKSFIISVVVSELIYALLMIIDAIHNPKSMMWLPVALLFLPLYTLPTAISASFGIGRIFEMNRQGRCINCGAEVSTTDNFCMKCGKTTASSDRVGDA